MKMIKNGLIFLCAAMLAPAVSSCNFSSRLQEMADTEIIKVTAEPGDIAWEKGDVIYFDEIVDKEKIMDTVSRALAVTDIVNGVATFTVETFSSKVYEIGGARGNFDYFMTTVEPDGMIRKDGTIIYPAYISSYQVLEENVVPNDELFAYLPGSNRRQNSIAVTFGRYGTVVKVNAHGLPAGEKLVSGTWFGGEEYIASATNKYSANYYLPDIRSCEVKDGYHSIDFSPEENVIKAGSDGTMSFLLYAYPGRITDWTRLELRVGAGVLYKGSIEGERLSFDSGGTTVLDFNMKIDSGGDTPDSKLDGAMTFETTEDNTSITVSARNVTTQKSAWIYTTDNGATFEAVSWDGDQAQVLIPAAGTQVKFMISGDDHWTGWNVIDFDKDTYVYGNMMSLVYGKDFAHATDISGEYNGTFYGLFAGNKHLVNHPVYDIELGATKIGMYAYYSTFSDCTGLTRAPELPALNAPAGCYALMFHGCTSLEEVPSAILADELEQMACMNMFEGCSKITSGPEIEATVYGDNALTSMFMDCTSLETAPVLKADKLLNGCCESMFWGCTSLKYIKCLASTFSYNSDIQGTTMWTHEVGKSGIFVRSKDSSLYDGAYSDIPIGLNAWVIGSGGIPEGWTIEVE